MRRRLAALCRALAELLEPVSRRGTFVIEGKSEGLWITSSERVYPSWSDLMWPDQPASEIDAGWTLDIPLPDRPARVPASDAPPTEPPKAGEADNP